MLNMRKEINMVCEKKINGWGGLKRGILVRFCEMILKLRFEGWKEVCYLNEGKGLVLGSILGRKMSKYKGFKVGMSGDNGERWYKMKLES